MTSIKLPPDIEGSLVKEAQRLGTTPELLALSGLRRLFVSADASEGQEKAETLFDLLINDIGSVEGTTEALSEHCGEHFSAGLSDRRELDRT